MDYASPVQRAYIAAVVGNTRLLCREMTWENVQGNDQLTMHRPRIGEPDKNVSRPFVLLCLVKPTAWHRRRRATSSFEREG